MAGGLVSLQPVGSATDPGRLTSGLAACTLTYMSATPTPMVRFFATTGENSDLGALSLAFLEGVVTLGLPVRVLSASGFAALNTDAHGNGGRWVRYRHLFMTTMVAPYVNVVCGDARAWSGLFTMGGGVVRNVLITDVDPASVQASDVARARLYQVLVVPTDELAERWRVAGAAPVVVPLSVLASAAAFKATLAA